MAHTQALVISSWSTSCTAWQYPPMPNTRCLNCESCCRKWRKSLAVRFRLGSGRAWGDGLDGPRGEPRALPGLGASSPQPSRVRPEAIPFLSPRARTAVVFPRADAAPWLPDLPLRGVLLEQRRQIHPLIERRHGRQAIDTCAHGCTSLPPSGRGAGGVAGLGGWPKGPTGSSQHLQTGKLVKPP